MQYPNFFQIIADRLSNIEALLIDIKHQPSVDTSTEPYGDFKWLKRICVGIPDSTLRIKSASGEIPGSIKFGKRVLYEKAVVLEWLRARKQTADDKTGTLDEIKITQQLPDKVTGRKGGKQS